MTEKVQQQTDILTGPEKRSAQLFSLYRFATRLYFFLPFLVLIFLQRGMSYSEAGLLLSLFSLASLFGGPIIQAALNGRRLVYVMIAAELLKLAGLLLLITSSDLARMSLAQVFSGLGYALSMGPDSQALRNRLPTDRYLETERNAHSIVFAGLFFAAVTGGILAQFDIDYTLIATLPVSLISITAAILLAKGHFNAPKKRRIIPKFPEGTVFAMAYGMTRGFLLAVFTAFLPIILFIEGNLPLWLLGGLIGIYSLISMTSARKAGVVLQKSGTGSALLGLFVLIGCISALFVLAGKSVIAACAIPILMGIILGFIRPATLQSLADRTPSEVSQAAMAGGDQLAALVSAIVILPGYVIIDLFGVQSGLLALAVFGFLLSLTGMFLVRQRPAHSSDFSS